MLSPNRIAKLAAAGQWSRLLDEVLANGRPLPEAARRRLHEPGVVRAAAACLGIQRALELTRGAVRAGEMAPLLDGLDATRERWGGDRVALAFVAAGLAAARAAWGDTIAPIDEVNELLSIGGERGALSGEGSEPLDALLCVWTLGGVEGFVTSTPNNIGAHAAGRLDLATMLAHATRAMARLDQRSPIASDLRVMRTLAIVASRRHISARTAA